MRSPRNTNTGRRPVVAALLLVLGAGLHAQGHIVHVTAITEVFGDGQKLSAVALEYDAPISNASVAKAAFSVVDRTITAAYASASAAKIVASSSGMGGARAIGSDGNFVLLELSPTDPKASTIEYLGQGPATTSRRAEVALSVSQVGAIKTTGGKTYAGSKKRIASDSVSNVMPAGFVRSLFEDPDIPGETLMYNLFVPKDYDENREYPLVLFMPDASATSDDPDMTLIQGLGALVWATDSEQAKHPCFVLAPQYAPGNGMENRAKLTYDLLMAVEGRYSIDANRLYTTGQSAGCITSIALDIEHPDLFAASYLVAGQYDAARVAPLATQNLWIMVSAGDIQALPGMNALTEALERHGATVARGILDAKSSANELAYHVDAMLARNANVKYTMLQRGTVVTPGKDDNPPNNHMGTWALAYSIEGIRDWLFSNVRTTGLSAAKIMERSMALARSGDSFGAYQYALRAQELGETGAAETLAESYASGRAGIPVDYALAVEYYETAVARGSARATTNLGLLYMEGKGVAQDYAKALAYFERATAAGDFKGPRWAGVIYLKGSGGIAMDTAKAASLFGIAADRGDVTANYYLGYLYENGVEFPRDYAKAAEYYEKAAPTVGHAEAAACTALGRLYENGLGVARDLVAAGAWYRRGAALGDKEAEAALTRIAGN